MVKEKDISWNWKTFLPNNIDSSTKNPDPEEKTEDFTAADNKVTDETVLTPDDLEMLADINNHTSQENP